MSPVRRWRSGHVGEDRHRVLGADDGDRDDRHAGSHRRAHEAAAAEPAQLVALPVELARALLALGEHERQLALVVQQALRVRRVRGHDADLVRQRPDPRVALEPVLGEHVERARRRVLVADRLHDHRSVGRQGARVVRHQQRAAVGRARSRHLPARRGTSSGSRSRAPAASGRRRAPTCPSRRARDPSRAPGSARAARAGRAPRRSAPPAVRAGRARRGAGRTPGGAHAGSRRPRRT